MKRSWPQGTKPCQVGGPLGAVVALQSICLMYLSVLQWHKKLPLHSNKEHLLTWSMCAHVWSPQIEICSIKTSTKLYMHTIIKQRIKCNIVSHYTHCLHKLHIKIIVKLSQEKKNNSHLCPSCRPTQTWMWVESAHGACRHHNKLFSGRGWHNTLYPNWDLDKMISHWKRGPHLHNNCGNCLDLLFMRTVVRKCHCCHT